MLTSASCCGHRAGSEEGSGSGDEGSASPVVSRQLNLRARQDYQGQSMLWSALVCSARRSRSVASISRATTTIGKGTWTPWLHTFEFELIFAPHFQVIPFPISTDVKLGMPNLNKMSELLYVVYVVYVVCAHSRIEPTGLFALA